MQIAKYRHILVALVMAAFIGSVTASEFTSCPNQTSPSYAVEPMHDVRMPNDGMTMSHTQHAGIKSLLADKLAMLDCCPDCDCSTGGCFTALLPAPQPTVSPGFTSARPNPHEVAISQLATPLFRPPILA